MKKILSILCLLLFVSTVAAAASPSEISVYIRQLESKLATAKSNENQSRIIKLQNLLEDAQARLAETRGSGQKMMAVEAQPAATESSDVAELREEVTEAIASLNSQIKGVEKKVDKGATTRGRAYLSYVLSDQGGSGDVNKFHIGRVYIDHKHKLAKDASVRFTTDMHHVDDDNYWDVYLKYAYFTLGNVDKHLPGANYLGLKSITVGQQATHWIDFMQKQWKFRYLAKTSTDMYGVFNSADNGIGLKGGFDLSSLEIPYLTRLDYHAIVVNGEGYKKEEANGGKDVALTLKMEPMRWGKKDYVITAVGYMVEDMGLRNFDMTGKTKHLTAMAAYHFSKPGGVVFVDYSDKAEGEEGGTSIGGQYKILPDTYVFGRLDNWKGNAKDSGSDTQNTICGVEYNWGKNVKIALNYQHERDLTNSTDDEKLLQLSTRVKW